MNASRRTPRQRTRRATIVLWSVAVVALAGAVAIIAFVTAQQIAFYTAQRAPTAVNVRPSFWLQAAWAIDGVPAVLLMVGLACAVAPFFLFAVAAQRRAAVEEAATGDEASAEP